jgi:hypothetical protein
VAVSPVLVALASAAAIWPYVSGWLVATSFLLPGVALALPRRWSLRFSAVAVASFFVVGWRQADALVIIPSTLGLLWCFMGLLEARLGSGYYGQLTGVRTTRLAEDFVLGTARSGEVIIGSNLRVRTRSAPLDAAAVMLRVDAPISPRPNEEERIWVRRPSRDHNDQHDRMPHLLELKAHGHATHVDGLDPVARACVLDLADPAGAWHPSAIARVTQELLAQYPGTEAFENATAAIAEMVLAVVTCASQAERRSVRGIELVIERCDGAVVLRYQYREIEQRVDLYHRVPGMDAATIRVAVGLLRRPVRPEFLSFA